MPQERKVATPHPPIETPMFHDVPMQALADMLKTLPVPITITQHLDTERETIFYRYQVGKTTPENPVGICMGTTRHFLKAVEFSLQAALNASTRKPLHQARRADHP